MNAICILESLVKKFESCRLTAYKCPAGVLTIGWGHTSGVEDGQIISQQYADALLRQDCNIRLEIAVQISPKLRSATPSQQAAIADFIYNCGHEAYKKSTLRRLIDCGDYNEASKEILRWNKATDPKTGKKRVLKGLARRRFEESKLLLIF